MATVALESLSRAFQETAAQCGEEIALRVEGGEQLSWRDYAARVERIARGLAALGVRRGDSVVLMMVNRPEFNLCDTAAFHLGAVPFSIYNTSAPEQIEQILANAAPRVAVCETQFAERLNAARGRSAIEHVVCVDGQPEGTLSLAALERDGDEQLDFESAWRAVGSDDLVTLIYTSGTTGPPKGVELTHANLTAELRATTALLPVLRGDRQISYLPSAHIADRWASHYLALATGMQVTSVADARELSAVLPQVRPTVWGAVPRVWEKLKASIEARIETEPDAARAAATRDAIAVGVRKVRAEQAAICGTGSGPDTELLASHRLADERVLAGIRALIGLDELRWAVCGAAPISIETIEFFAALGLPILELWGMSELSACATINPPERIKFGTVGTALEGVELRLAGDGELLCRGVILMRGYRSERQKTAEAIDADGWLHTGDIAEIDDEGYVRIVDRKKELIINAAGKNMSPANIEARLKESSSLIGQAVAIGDRRPYNVALIVLDPDACAAYAAKHELGEGSAEALAADAGVCGAVAQAIERANGRLARVEQIKRHAILPADWLPGGDELTPTMKLKRKPIAAKYAEQIDTLYAG